MPKLTPDQIRQIADSLISGQNILTNYLTANRNRLSKDEKMMINDAADRLSEVATSLIALAIQGTAQEMQLAVQGIKDATNIANMALDTLNDIKSALNIVAKLLGLATSIASGNPAAIIAAANAIIKEVNLSNVKRQL